jgi:small subunit ribosomal protein S17
MAERGQRKREVGVVTSAAMDKTIVIKIERITRHPKYGKYTRRARKVLAHDPESAAKVGDRVEIVESRPLSRRKRWRLVRVLAAAHSEEARAAE